MKNAARFAWLAAGIGVGLLIAALYGGNITPVRAANDRYQDFILCTGPVTVNPLAPTDGVWLLDYRTGRLLGTVIDRGAGRIVNWAEVDLAGEFGLRNRQNAHFMMTTGTVTQGQAALYVAETTTGKFGVYTMGPRPDGQAGIAIRRHDQVMFRPEQR